jgi:hypothetical protein
MNWMSHYLVVHDVPSFKEHNDWIGREAESVPAGFKMLRRGDGIIYYCKGDGVITGTFRVASAPKIVESRGRKYWQGTFVVVKIRPVAKAKAPYYVSAKTMLEELPDPLSIFPDRKIAGIRLKGRTFVKITKRDFDAVTRYVRNYRPSRLLFQGRSNDAGLGEPRELGVMNYAPTSEQGVVALFVGHMKALGFEKLEFVRQGFPDACAIRKSGSAYTRKFIEFEYRASQFRQHVNDPTHRSFRCDYVVCWENDYPTCPVEVIELASEMDRILAARHAIEA